MLIDDCNVTIAIHIILNWYEWSFMIVGNTSQKHVFRWKFRNLLIDWRIMRQFPNVRIIWAAINYRFINKEQMFEVGIDVINAIIQTFQCCFG
jgi:hypothetical protein